MCKINQKFGADGSGVLFMVYAFKKYIARLRGSYHYMLSRVLPPSICHSKLHCNMRTYRYDPLIYDLLKNNLKNANYHDEKSPVANLRT